MYPVYPLDSMVNEFDENMTLRRWRKRYELHYDKYMCMHACTHTPLPSLRAALQLMKTLNFSACKAHIHPFMGRLAVRMVTLYEVSRNVI